MYLLGYDVGSSSIKAALLNAETGRVIASAAAPDKEMPILARRPGWAEQDPSSWWDNVKAATAKIKNAAAQELAQVKAIGISYQMHGLVMVDKSRQVLRPSIIWCDSRAVSIGEQAFAVLGPKKCLKHLLNSPGNFTASKLKWVMENEGDLFKKTYKIMLPGDYIAMRLTDQIKTTPTGLSEGILWDFSQDQLAHLVLDHYGFSPDLIPELTATFSHQGEITPAAAADLGLKTGIPVTYRAGDQPNNAFSLNVLQPGEIAATAGTSGVVYGVSDQLSYDPQSRVNTFVHVNHSHDKPRYGVLLCLNGTGILNSWLKHNAMGSGDDYEKMNALARQAPIGSDGLCILPYGNGAERTLGNKDIGAIIEGLKFNTHNRCHLLRAAQEGIVFALNYGLSIMRQVGVKAKTVRAGQANMFLSPLFSQAFATVTDSTVELYNTDGAQGAARAARIGAGIYKNTADAFIGLDRREVIEPADSDKEAYQAAYQNWLKVLKSKIDSGNS